MTTHKLPSLNTSALADTRDACHAYANVLGNWMASCRLRRKHWWQLSLRPTLRGVTSGMVHADGVHFELELDLQNNQVQGEIAGGESFNQTLGKQTAAELAEDVRAFLLAGGVDPRFVPDTTPQEGHDALSGEVKDGYSAESAREFAAVWREVSHAYAIFRAEIPEETSPIMVWPGHFDLCMMWIPGQKIPGQDPENEEYSDKQMNFGFSLGDEGIPEPYFYITAYPLPDAFPTLKLPADATWYTEGFNGVVLRYETLQKSPEAQTELVGLLKFLVASGREHMLEH